MDHYTQSTTKQDHLGRRKVVLGKLQVVLGRLHVVLGVWKTSSELGKLKWGWENPK